MLDDCICYFTLAFNGDSCFRLTIPSYLLCDELITRPEESYRLWCVVVCDLENFMNEEARAPWGLLRQMKIIMMMMMMMMMIIIIILIIIITIIIIIIQKVLQCEA